MDMNTKHVATKPPSGKDANRQAFPELTGFVDALNAALAGHGAAPARVTYLERPGLTLGKKDQRQYVPITFMNGKPANGSEWCKKTGKHKDDLIR